MSKVFALLVEYCFEDDEATEGFEVAVRTVGDRLRSLPAPPSNVTAFAGDEANGLARHAFGRDIERGLRPWPPAKRT